MNDKINELYKLRQSRKLHPNGYFDKGGRWYPHDDERRPCCDSIRHPSRRFPYSLLTHCRTKRHITMLLEGHE